jgi:hypothetical protein
MKKSLLFLLVLSPLFSASAEPMPRCFDERSELQVSNESVIQYKSTMPNLKKIQVFVKAKFVREMQPTMNQFGQHQHFIVNLREDISDKAGLIEIAHSMNGYTFPEASDLKAGPIYICAEYSTTDKNGYPKITKFTPSETGAMLHWTHQASKSNIDMKAGGHPNGWIYANGKVFGRYNNGKFVQ